MARLSEPGLENTGMVDPPTVSNLQRIIYNEAISSFMLIRTARSTKVLAAERTLEPKNFQLTPE